MHRCNMYVHMLVTRCRKNNDITSNVSGKSRVIKRRVKYSYSCKMSTYNREILLDCINLGNFQRTCGVPRKTFGEARETKRRIIHSSTYTGWACKTSVPSLKEHADQAVQLIFILRQGLCESSLVIFHREIDVKSFLVLPSLK